MRVAAILCTLTWSAVALADAPLRPPSRIEEYSSTRRYVAVADPKRDVIAVYRVDGHDRTELWTLSSWQRSFALADDGDHLVVCYSGGNLLSLDYTPTWTMLRFYRRDALVRQWSLRELVPDLSKLQRTVSHYYWGRCLGFDETGAFRVETVDRGILRFSVQTGALAKDGGSMPPVLIAFLKVVLLFVACWMTRAIRMKGRKWGLRAAAFIVLFIILPVALLSDHPQAAVISAKYSVYFGILAVVTYMIAERLPSTRT